MAHNKITIHGYLGRKPELKTYQNNKGETKDLVNFSVAVSRNGDGTDWFNCTMFGARAKAIEKFMDKGSQIILTGRMQNDIVEKDGTKKSYWKIIVEDFDFCDPKDSPRGQSNNAVQETAKGEDIPDSFAAAEEDIPF